MLIGIAIHCGAYPKPECHKRISLYRSEYGCEKLIALWIFSLCIEIVYQKKPQLRGFFISTV